MTVITFLNQLSFFTQVCHRKIPLVIFVVYILLVYWSVDSRVIVYSLILICWTWEWWHASLYCKEFNLMLNNEQCRVCGCCSNFWFSCISATISVMILLLITNITTTSIIERLIPTTTRNEAVIVGIVTSFFLLVSSGVETYYWTTYVIAQRKSSLATEKTPFVQTRTDIYYSGCQGFLLK